MYKMLYKKIVLSDKWKETIVIIVVSKGRIVKNLVS